MTYEIGQKILVEAEVVKIGDPHADSILVRIDGAGGIYVSDDILHNIVTEPEFIEFFDVQVGDTVRTTLSYDDGTKRISVGYVGYRNAKYFNIGKHYSIHSDTEQTIELLERSGPPINVGDSISLSRVRSLPLGSVVVSDQPHTVSSNGLFDAKDDTTYSWLDYSMGMREFKVMYIAEVS